MARLIVFDLLQNANKTTGDRAKDLMTIAFDTWLSKADIISCDWDHAAVSYSNRHSRKPPYDCLKRLTSKNCDGRVLLYDEQMKPTFIESSICGDYVIILDIIYAALAKTVPFIIIDFETAVRTTRINSLFTSRDRFGLKLTSYIVEGYTGAETEKEHVLKIIKDEKPDKLNAKAMLLINVDTMYPTWFDAKLTPTREMAMHFVLQEMVDYIVNKQYNATIIVSEKPNKNGRQPQRFLASLKYDTISFIEKGKKLEIQLGTVAGRNINPETQAQASTNFRLIARNAMAFY